MKHLQWKKLLLEANMSLMFKFSKEMLSFESGDTQASKAARNKLFASNEKQIDNHTLLYVILLSYMSVVHTYYCRGVFKNLFWCGSSLLIFVVKKATKGAEL